MTKTLFVLLVSVLMVGTAKAEFKMGYVDMQKAIQSSKAGKKAKDSLQAEADKRNKDLDKKKQDIEKMKEDYEKKASVLTDEVRKKKEMEIQEEMMKWNQNAGKAQADLQKKEGELLAPIVDKLKKLIEKIAKEKGMAMVIQSNPSAQIVMYSQPEYDLTDALIKAFDAEK